jgi:hypothetical protein
MSQTETADVNPGDFLYVLRNADTPEAEFRAIVTDYDGAERFVLTLVPSPADGCIPTGDQPHYLTVYSVVRIERTGDGRVNGT